MLSDLEIAQQARLKPIADIAAALGLAEDEVELYGRYKAKIELGALRRLEGRPTASTSTSPRSRRRRSARGRPRPRSVSPWP